MDLKCFIRVDNRTYSLLDHPSDGLASVSDFTPTQTTISMQAGAMNVVATFLSPIEVETTAFSFVRRLIFLGQPTDPVKQSIPFGYLSLELSSFNDSYHDVQVLCSMSHRT